MKIEPCFGLSFIVWKDERLADFELELRYRLPDGGNSSVEIRSQPDLTGEAWPQDSLAVRPILSTKTIYSIS